MGSAVQMHDSRDNRGTWAERSIDGWYLGTSLEHYRCHIIHVKKTKSERISDTVFFKHKYITQPTLTPVDTVIKAIDDLTCALKGSRNTHGMQQIERLKIIDELLSKIPSNLTEMSDPSTSNTSKSGRHQTRTNTTNLSISSSKHRRHTKTNIGASSKGAKRK